MNYFLATPVRVHSCLVVGVATYFFYPTLALRIFPRRAKNIPGIDLFNSGYSKIENEL